MNLTQVLELDCGSLYPIKDLSQFLQIDQAIMLQHYRQLRHAGLLFSIG
jgi:DNA-binding IscR family transcriptional regulator